MGNKISKIYVGTNQVRPSGGGGENIYIWTGTRQPQSGIYTKDGLISISSDGSNWITIADKNLGATTVYNYGDTLNSANGGCIYQWGNNYGFPYTGTITVVGTPIDASAYGPGNYYYSSTYRWNSSGGYSTAYWDTSENTNLWGDVTDTLTARQGPCPSGYHIATQTEWGNLQSAMTSLGITSQTGWRTYLKIPLTGYRKGTEGGTPAYVGTNAYWWSSTWRDGIQPSVKSSRAWDLAIESSIYNTDSSGTSSGLAIRPMKNTPEIPDSTWTVIYQGS